MKKLYFLSLVLGTALTFGQTNVGITGNVDGVYINEFHYDNASNDVGEFIEIAGPSGTNLSTYTITLYDGVTGASYGTLALSGIIDDEGAGVGAVSFSYPVNGIQNGSPDSIALSKTGSTNIQFISYEGVGAVATNGAASGLTPVDILVSEPNTTPIGYSLEYDEATSAWIVITDDTPGDFAQGPAVLSTSSFNAIEGLRMYPNPLTGNTLNITSAANADMSVQIFDILGKEVLSTKVINNTLNASRLNAGVYIVKITEEGNTATRKLVVR